jgi:hypothetical protein
MHEKHDLVMSLCERAKNEVDSTKLLELVKQINQLLDEIHGKRKEDRNAS